MLFLIVGNGFFEHLFRFAYRIVYAVFFAVLDVFFRHILQLVGVVEPVVYLLCKAFSAARFEKSELRSCGFRRVRDIWHDAAREGFDTGDRLYFDVSRVNVYVRIVDDVNEFFFVVESERHGIFQILFRKTLVSI